MSATTSIGDRAQPRHAVESPMTIEQVVAWLRENARDLHEEAGIPSDDEYVAVPRLAADMLERYAALCRPLPVADPRRIIEETRHAS